MLKYVKICCKIGFFTPYTTFLFLKHIFKKSVSPKMFLRCSKKFRTTFVPFGCILSKFQHLLKKGPEIEFFNFGPKNLKLKIKILYDDLKTLVKYWARMCAPTLQNLG